jgi:hypothetical protein
MSQAGGTTTSITAITTDKNREGRFLASEGQETEFGNVLEVRPIVCRQWGIQPKRRCGNPCVLRAQRSTSGPRVCAKLCPQSAQRVVGINGAKSVDELLEQRTPPSAPARRYRAHPHPGDGHETENELETAKSISVSFC